MSLEAQNTFPQAPDYRPTMLSSVSPVELILLNILLKLNHFIFSLK